MCVFVLYCASCRFGLQDVFYRDNSVNSRAAVLEDISPPSVTSPERYSFVLLSDIHFGRTEHSAFLPGEQFFASVRERVAAGGAEKPSFAVMLGDVANTGRKAEYEEYSAFVGQLEAELGPGSICYTVVGNHDLYNSGWKIWRGTVYPYTSFYRFTAGSRSFYFLDTGSGTLGAKQFEELERKMKADTNPGKLVFTHYPLYGSGNIPYFLLTDTRERAMLIKLFACSGVDAYFAGHYHPGGYSDFAAFREIVTGSVYGKSDRPARWFFIEIDEDRKVMTVAKYSVSAAGQAPAVQTEQYPL